MTPVSRRLFLASTLAAGAGFGALDRRAGGRAAAREFATGGFVCPPCGCSMDDVVFEAPGTCPDCGMVLRPRTEADLGFEPARLDPGAGFFEVAGNGEGRMIRVHYYLPPGFGAESRILLVIPGAGRDSDEYRNVWLDTAAREKVLVAALGYA